jgi:hypothetical protein
MNDPIDRLIGLTDPSTPVGALAEFYEAFNTRDLELMAANWLQSPQASMSNPLGGIKRGWDEIQSVYQTIFGGHARVRVEFHDYEIFEREGFFQAVGRERGALVMGDKSLTLRIRTSRCFVRQGGRFFQLHHHGSMDESRLLEDYQSALRTGKLS